MLCVEHHVRVCVAAKKKTEEIFSVLEFHGTSESIGEDEHPFGN
jgi:hypothetical protein